MLLTIQVVEQCTGNLNAVGSMRENNFFALLVLSSRRSHDSSVGFRAGTFRPDSMQTIQY